MKIVKADAKGRITGFKPGHEYDLREGAWGEMTASPHWEETEYAGDVSVTEFFKLLGLDPTRVSAGHDIRVAELKGDLADADHLFGLYVTEFKLDEEGKTIPDRDGGHQTKVKVVRLRFDVLQ